MIYFGRYSLCGKWTTNLKDIGIVLSGQVVMYSQFIL